MNREDFIRGLADLNKPDQGMRYHGGGFDHDAPAFDDQTGERLPPRYKDAELTLHGRRAQFIYRLIEGADTLASALTAHPSDPAATERMRAALVEIANNGTLPHDSTDEFDRGAKAARLDAADIARAALGEA